MSCVPGSWLEKHLRVGGSRVEAETGRKWGKGQRMWWGGSRASGGRSGWDKRARGPPNPPPPTDFPALVVGAG